MESLRKKVNAGPLREVMGHFRNTFGGHYDREAFARSLTLLDDSDLMDLPVKSSFETLLFNVTDRLFDVLLIEKSHAQYHGDDKEHSVEQALNAVIDVAEDVMNLAIGLVWGMYYEAVSH